MAVIIWKNRLSGKWSNINHKFLFWVMWSISCSKIPLIQPISIFIVQTRFVVKWMLVITNFRPKKLQRTEDYHRMGWSNSLQLLLCNPPPLVNNFRVENTKVFNIGKQKHKGEYGGFSILKQKILDMSGYELISLKSLFLWYPKVPILRNGLWIMRERSQC